MSGQQDMQLEMKRDRFIPRDQIPDSIWIETILAGRLFPMSGIRIEGVRKEELTPLREVGQAGLGPGQPQKEVPTVEDLSSFDVQRVQAPNPKFMEQSVPSLGRQRNDSDNVNYSQTIRRSCYVGDLLRDFQETATEIVGPVTTMGTLLEVIELQGLGRPIGAALVLADCDGVAVSSRQKQEMFALDKIPQLYCAALVALTKVCRAREGKIDIPSLCSDIDRFLEMIDERKRLLAPIGILDVLSENDRADIMDPGVNVDFIFDICTQFLAAVIVLQRDWKDYSMAATTIADNAPKVNFYRVLTMGHYDSGTINEAYYVLVVDISVNDKSLNGRERKLGRGA